MAERFDALVGDFDGPLVIVTTAVGPERAGCLVGFHCQSSIEPRRYAVWLSKANHTFRVATLATHLAIHLPTPDVLDLAELFGGLTGDEVDKFARCRWEAGPEGVPLLLRCPRRIVARKTALLDEGGDHVCLVAEPVEVHGEAPFTPLRLGQAEGIEPGHPAWQRPRPDDLRA